MSTDWSFFWVDRFYFEVQPHLFFSLRDGISQYLVRHPVTREVIAHTTSEAAAEAALRLLVHPKPESRLLEPTETI